MITKRQENLIRDYGPRFCQRNRDIQTEFLHLSSDAVSVLTDAEWEECAKAIDNVVEKLNQVYDIVAERMEKVGVKSRSPS